MIVPDHGVIWHKDPLQIVTKCREWTAQVPERRAVILYETMWEGTRRMEEAIDKGRAAEGIPHKILHVAVSDRSDIITEIIKSEAIIVGSPTLNNGVLPSLAPILEDLRGLEFQNKFGAAFGS